jgi:hypothetical protein
VATRQVESVVVQVEDVKQVKIRAKGGGLRMSTAEGDQHLHVHHHSCHSSCSHGFSVLQREWNIIEPMPIDDFTI